MSNQSIHVDLLFLYSGNPVSSLTLTGRLPDTGESGKGTIGFINCVGEVIWPP